MLTVMKELSVDLLLKYYPDFYNKFLLLFAEAYGEFYQTFKMERGENSELVIDLKNISK